MFLQHHIQTTWSGLLSRNTQQYSTMADIAYIGKIENEIIIIIHKINLTYINELPSFLRKRLDLSVQLAPIPGVVTELQGDHHGRDDYDDGDTKDDDDADDEVTPGRQ